MTTQNRSLMVCADDFGIGPETSRGILELAALGVVTDTVLLANSPFATRAVEAWRKLARRPNLGWHPCLTLDAPVLPAWKVPSLVRHDGVFHPLGSFLRRWLRGRIRPDEVAAEWQAQYRRFQDLVGEPPALVNAHHHLHIFPPLGDILLDILEPHRPHVRRVCESWTTLARVSGARGKRSALNLLGARQAQRQERRGFPGAACLLGLADSVFPVRRDFFERWLRLAQGRSVELMCHPGYPDEMLAGREAVTNRYGEWKQLASPEFADACRAVGFELPRIEEPVAPGVIRHAA